MLHGILSALGGTDEDVYSRDAKGNIVRGIKDEGGNIIPLKSGAGQQWKRIIAGGLEGAAAGAGVAPGPGSKGRAAAAGFAAGAHGRQEQDERAFGRAKENAEISDKSMAAKAQQAYYAQEVTRLSLENTRLGRQMSQESVDSASQLYNLLHSDPNAEDLGTYSDFAAFLKDHAANGKQIGELSTNGEIRPVPAYDASGKPAGFHMVRVSPEWSESRNTEPRQVIVGMQVGKGGKLVPNIQTIPAGGEKNSTITALQNNGIKLLSEHDKDVSEAAERASATRKNNADAAKAIAETGALKQASDAGEMQKAAQLLVEGNEDPSQLSKRSKLYQPTLNAANEYSMQKYGKPFDIAKAASDYKFATNPQTQNTLKYLNSLVGADDKGGNLQALVDISNRINRTDFPPLNNVEAWAKLNTGDPVMAGYNTALIEVSDQAAKILQSGGTGNGTSDYKLRQAQELFDKKFTKEQIAGQDGIAPTLRTLLGNRKKEMIGDNRYLVKMFGSGGQKQPSAPPSGATGKAKGSDGKWHWTDGKQDLGVAE